MMVYEEMSNQITAAIMYDKMRHIYAYQILFWGQYTSATLDDAIKNSNSNYGGMGNYKHV